MRAQNLLCCVAHRVVGLLCGSEISAQPTEDGKELSGAGTQQGCYYPSGSVGTVTSCPPLPAFVPLAVPHLPFVSPILPLQPFSHILVWGRVSISLSDQMVSL